MSESNKIPFKLQTEQTLVKKNMYFGTVDPQKITKMTQSISANLEEKIVDDDLMAINVCANVPKTTAELRVKMTQLVKSYYPNSAPPSWGMEMTKQDFDYMADVTYYYDTDDNASTTLQNVKQLAMKREPTNIRYNQLYNKKELIEFGCYDAGCYDKFTDSINISCLTKNTPFRHSIKEKKEVERKILSANKKINKTIEVDQKLLADIQEMKILLQTAIHVNILHVYAPAFDSDKQIDCTKYFRYDDPTRKKNLITRFELIFRMTFECALQENFTEIYMCGFGLGEFNNNVDHYVQGLHDALKLYATNDDFNRIKLIFWDYNMNTYRKIVEKVQGIEFIQFNYNQLYNEIHKISQVKNMSTILFHNAWDPFSIIGNGNEQDGSFDGQWGRRTLCSFFSMLQLNDKIKFKNIAK